MNWPLLQQGATGEDVRSVQYLLNANGASLAVDGIFGPLTTDTVRAFQNAHGLAVDGIVGNQTWPALISIVSSGSSGDAVRAVQSQLNSRAGGWLTVDGVFGPDTDRIVRDFQGDIGLAVDGIVGPKTWHALVSGFLASHDASAATEMFQAWTQRDRDAALKNGTPQAVNELFARTWSASDGWTFNQCGGAAGHFVCTWSRPGGQLMLEGNNNTGAPFYFVENVTFTP